MDWNWVFQLLLAVTSAVLEQRNELLERSTNENNLDNLSNAGQSSHREPRFAAVPPGAPIVLGLIYLFPTSVIIIFRRRRLEDLTELGKKKKEGDLNLLIDNKDQNNDSSSSSNETAPVVGTSPDEDVALNSTDADAETITALPASNDDDGHDVDAVEQIVEEGRGLLVDPWQTLDNDVLHDAQLSKLDAYFYQFEIEGDNCRRRIVCELAAAPESFYPISDVVLRQIKPTVPVTPSKSSRFYQFLNAAKTGFNGDTKACEKQYKCNYGADDILDDKVLRVFQLLGKQLDIEFVDYE